jgi:serine/threonine protein kinase
MPLSPLDLFGSEPAPRPQSPLSPRAPAAQVQPVVIGFLSASTDGAVDESSDAASHAGLTGKQRDLSAWLDSLDLLFLDELFRKQRTDIDTVRYLGKEDLLEHGVVGIGPLKKLLVEIERLRTHGVKTPHCELPPMAPPVSSPPLSPTVQRVASTPSTAARERDADDGAEVAAGDGDDDGDNSIVQLMRSGEMTASGGSATEAMAGSGSQSAGQLRRALNAQRHLLTDIRKTRSIGEGAFGQVFEGVWQGTTRVAMKRLSDATHARAFEKEANLLRDLRHPNVVMFVGLFRDERGEMWIVTEFLSLGSLRHLLHRDGARVTSSALLLMAKDAAAGMKYLSQNRILHRDLAARNLLVKAEDKRFVVKVADFGLSRVTDGTTYYSRSRKFPVKWTAPEALQFAKFTSKSDVWSFGVVLWEMYEFGKVPYQGMSNRDAMQFVLSGNRLPRPDACPADLYRLMLDCWRADAQQRPSFQQIYDAVVEQLMRDTHPTVFSLNAADGQVRGRPTAVLDAAPDEAYYADESGVQITRAVRAEVADYVEPEPTAAAAASNNRNASDAFRAYAVASMYRSADGGDRSATSSEAGGDASAAASSSASTFGLSSAMPSIFTLDPARLTTRELTSMIDFDSDKRGIASPPQQPKVDEIRDSHGSDDSEPYEYDDDDSRDHSGAAGTSRRAIRAAFPDYDDEVGRT